MGSGNIAKILFRVANAQPLWANSQPQGLEHHVGQGNFCASF